MAKFLPALLLCFTVTGLVAQVELSSNYFPKAGDTLRTATADSAWASQQDLILAGGTELAWSFTNLVASSDSDDPVTAVDADDLLLFPDAEVKIRTNIFTESYYRTEADIFELVGVRSRLDIFPDFEIEAPVSPVRPTRRSPLRFGDSFSSSTANIVIISTDSIPPEILAALNLDIINFADSIRVTTTSNRVDEVDAWGNVRLEDNFYDVLREKRVESINITIDVKRNPIPTWTPVTALLEQVPQIAPFVGEQSGITTYLFWNEESIEPIVEVITRTQDTAIVDMFYKRAQTATSLGGPGRVQARVKVYPNPATDLATFEMEGLERGDYTLLLIDGMGREISRREFTPFGNLTRLNLDVSNMPSGLYLYSLRNERGRTITTKRLLVR